MKNHIKVLVVLFALAFLSFSAKAQQDGRPKPKIGFVYGSVIDESTKSPIEFATVTLYQKRDSSLVTGGITDSDGKFSIKEIPVGRYFAKFNFIGYIPFTSEPFKLSPRESTEMNFGKIELESNIQNIEEAVVSVETDFVENKIDRKVYNVGSDLNSKGGTANDIMRNIPSLDVDIDGKLTLRGSENLTILIDGKPSGLTGDSEESFLASLPSNAIEKVEVITSPSAKYDPEGMSGIVNIILKKNRLEGFHGSASLNLGTSGNYNAGLSLNYRTNKFSFTSNSGFNYRDNYFLSENNRTSTFDEETISLSQENNGDRLTQDLFVNLAGEYFISEKSSVSIGTNLSSNNQESYSLGTTFEQLDLYLLDVVEENSSENERFNYDAFVNFNQTFSDPKQTLMASLNYSNFSSISESVFDDLEKIDDLDPVLFSQLSINDNQRKNLMIQADYSDLKNESNTFEFGYKSIIREVNTDLDISELEDDTYENDPNLSNEFLYQEAIHALYGVYGFKVNAIGVQVGLRGEIVQTDAKLFDTNETFENDYESLYPSMHLLYDLDDEQNLKLSYNRRVDRPNSRRINPFPSYSDERNLRKGNPFLLPTYTNTIELEYVKEKKRNLFSFATYYQLQTDVIRSFQTVDSAGIATSTFENLTNSQNFGAEMTLRLKISKNLSTTLSGNINMRLDDPIGIEGDFNLQGVSGRSKIALNYKTDNGWNFQANGRYRGPRILLQGRINGIFYGDVAVQKSILDGRGTLGLRMQDALNTRVFKYSRTDLNFTQNTLRDRESQIIFLSFSYRFGKLDIKRSKGSRNPNSGSDQDFSE